MDYINTKNKNNILENVKFRKQSKYRLRTSVNDFNIIAYNISGLSSKILYPEFLRFIRQSEVFLLSETMVMENKIENFRNLFPDHQQHWIPATKLNPNRPGRPSEGSLFGIKNKGLSHGNFLEYAGHTFIEFSIRGAKYYVLPVYLNDSKWQSAFGELKNICNEFNHENLLIIGDLNARIGTENVTLELESLGNSGETRNSKDTKIDKRGKYLLELCCEYGFTICNGCVMGDEEGELTFLNTNGGSVIDLCLIRGKWREVIGKFEVIDLNYAEHFPIQLKIVRPECGDRNKINLLPKLQWNQRRVSQYRDQIKALVTPEINETHGNINDCYNMLIDTIKTAQKGNEIKKTQKGKEKWYTWKCEEARKVVFSLLKKYRRTGNDIFKSLYLEQNRKFKEICRNSKLVYGKKLAQELVHVKDTKEFWQLVKKIQNVMPHKETILTAMQLANYFAIQLNPPQTKITFQYAENFTQCEALDAPFQLEELKSLVKQLQDKKAPGLDRISYEFYKNAPDDFLLKLLDLYNRIFDKAIIPDAFRKSLIFPIHKKGDPKEPSNYRAIAFTDAAVKIFCSLLTKRLNRFIEERSLLSEFQAGFREGYGTNDHIFTLVNTIELYKIKKKKLYCMFIDFKAAFDHVNRNALVYKLSQFGISFKFLQIIKSLYTKTTSSVWDGSEVSEEFATLSGLKQGCIISPTLFNLFINDIVDVLPGGAKMMDMVIKVLLYADDLVIFAETPESLQLMINRIKEYCKKWNLVVNLEKSKIMVLKGSAKMAKNEKWHWGTEVINTVKEYKYLGFLITPQLNNNKHFEEKFKQTVRILGSTWRTFMANKEIATSTKFQIFKSVIRSVICYSGQTWGYNQYNAVEKVQKYFLKRLFKLPFNTPDYMLYVETGLAPLYLYTFKLHADYICKIMTGDPNRIARKIAAIICQKKVLYIRKWMELSEEHDLDIQLNLDNSLAWKDQICELMEKMDTNIWKRNIFKAQTSNHRNVYINLNHSLGINGYFHDKYDTNIISNVFKVRGELLKLNYTPHIETNSTICNLCNLNRLEDSLHFIGECPMLKEIRIIYFGKTQLSEKESYDYLNGKDWRALAYYVMEATTYRNKFKL